jgi:D-3-phosphoglycerate dehydrogenase
MGYMAAQATRSAVKSIKITTSGDVSEYIDSLATFAMVGVLKESLADAVNYVNVEFVASDRGIVLEKVRSTIDSGLKNKVTVKILTEEQKFTISGTIFGENLKRIVEIDEYMLDLEPKGRMILFRNTDVKGVIGDVGKIISEHNLNISDFRLGRNNKSEALAVVKVDGDVTKSLIKELESLPACIAVTHVTI